jgi:hypothetical protein
MNIPEPERKLRAISFAIDTNCINSRQKMSAMNQLELWAEDGLFQLLTSDVAQTEALAGNSAVRRAKAYRFLCMSAEATTDEDQEFLRAVEKCLFPAGARNQNERNDAEIVFIAGKYHRPLITTDGASKSQPVGIHGSRNKLAALGIEVLSPEEAVDRVRNEIQSRDEHAQEFSRRTGVALAPWVGRD